MRDSSFAAVRLILYSILMFWAFLLFCLCCARMSYTSYAGPNRVLSYYDAAIGELLVSAIFTLFFVPTMFWMIRSRSSAIPARVWFEVTGLSVLWLFWICGAGAASNYFGSLSWCHDGACSVVRALLAFAWLGWITLTVLLGGSLAFAIKYGGWNSEVCDSWGSTAGRNSKV
ncbi:hypothetical protein FRB94_000203 [Tulasnella sp. JGI-2019a]|nr:hypothetical protein FRB94_000203 [Tulasnella sp. JGI-2019a]KAG9015339.1 hypothetical protein FRB93_013039 [Tulasnella sp. JGI-2019a]